ncbi:hypothetical protein [Bacillus sp. V33-4]|uniref:hypothetical protein n=1 Tax=Bacillus sp. V33-4 TaxID=2054169 RepID=UPI000C7601A2|nr:hypothetical protein [Bacillus sp. V33-4]PLR85685.1 hypothetical protein CVD23_08305 [Bacillus sp. V33-4]
MNTDFELTPLIFRGESPFVIADEILKDNVDDVLEAILIKYYHKVESSDYVDYYDILEELEWELSSKQQKYLALVSDIQFIDRKYRKMIT